MTRFTWMLMAALAASAGLNVWQWRSRPAAVAPDALAQSPYRSPSPSPSPPPSPYRSPSPSPPPSPSPSPSARPPAIPAAADHAAQAAMLAGRLEEAEAELEDHLRPDERFDRAPRDPELEARFRPLLEAVLTGAPAGLSWELECHGEVCRVQVLEPDDTEFDWSQRLQGKELRALWTGFQIGAGRRTGQVASKPARTSDAYLVLKDPDAIGAPRPRQD